MTAALLLLDTLFSVNCVCCCCVCPLRNKKFLLLVHMKLRRVFNRHNLSTCKNDLTYCVGTHNEQKLVFPAYLFDLAILHLYFFSIRNTKKKLVLKF